MSIEVFWEVNYLAVLVAAIVGMGVGALWYGPLFGKVWLSLMGWTNEQMARMKEQGMAKSYFVNFLGLLVMAWVLSGFIEVSGVATFWLGACIGAWVWLGFVATILLTDVLWEGRPSKLYLLNIAQWFVTLFLMGGIIAIWQ